MRIFLFAVFKVEGESMLPDFHPGDFIVVNRWPHIIGKPKIGDVVVLRDPRDPKRVLVKRVVKVLPEGVEVRGDNEAASTDSRTLGIISFDLVVGKVIAKF